MLSKKVQILGETVKKLLDCHAEENLKNILARAHAADIAYVLGGMDLEQQTQIMEVLRNVEQRAAVISEMQLNQVTPLLQHLGTHKAADIVNHLSPDDAADILAQLPDELSSALLLLLKKEEAEEVEDLIRYPPDTAGGIMSPEVFSLPEELTVAQAIEKIQQSRDVESVFYVYVVNQQENLVGVLSLKKMILASPKATLQEVMEKDPIRVRVDEDQEEVARTVSRYNYLALPVIDDANKLVGVVTVDDVIDVIKEEATEDILRMTGADRGAMEKGSVWSSLKKRVPWFLVTLVGGLLVAEVIGRFDSAITKMALLAGFIPLVLRMGGSMGAQALAIVVSSLSASRMSFAQVWTVLFKEFRIALILGLTYGLALTLFTFVRFGNFTDLSPMVPVAIGTALALSMVISVGIGGLVPLCFQKMGLDPATATGSFVILFIDIFSMWTYFFLATRFIHI